VIGRELLQTELELSPTLALNCTWGTTCSPAQWMLALMRMLGNTFVGFEIGHHFCDATNDKYIEAYGVDR
jgi:hypothetical protein